MKNIFTLFLIMSVAPIYTMGLPGKMVSVEGIQETTIENFQQQAPMTSLMQAMQRLYASDSSKIGISSTNVREQKKEKTFLGMTAPLSDQEMERYLSWQKQGDLPLMENELHELNYHISQRSKLSFDRFKLERRKSFLCKVMGNEITKNLSIVRRGTLEQAEKLVWDLEHSPMAQFEPSYYEIKKQELMLAQRILSARPDYRAKYSLDSKTAQSPALTLQSNSSSSSSLSSTQQQQIDRIACTTDMTTDAPFARAYSTLPKTDFAKMHIELHKQIMVDVYEQMQKDGAFTSRESVNAWLDGLYNEFTNKHGALIEDIKLFAVACYLSGGANVVIVAAEAVPVIAEVVMARGTAFSSKLASRLAADGEAIGTVQMETEKPLDYAHNAVQYEKLKDALHKEQYEKIVSCTDHGLQRIMERFTPEQVEAIIQTPDAVRIQKDGAKALIKKIGDKYSIITMNPITNKAITGINGLSIKDVINLGKNYGWEL